MDSQVLASSCSLDIDTILASSAVSTSTSILATQASSGALLTNYDSLYFETDAISPFSTQSVSRPLFLNISVPPTLCTQTYSDVRKALITIPTIPRMRDMIMEKISIKKWAERISPTDALDHAPFDFIPESEVLYEPPWIPQGSLLSPEHFRVALRKLRHRDTHTDSERSPATPSFDLGLDTYLSSTSRGISSLIDTDIVESPCSPGSTDKDTLIVPTLMLSNSSIAVRLSVESFLSIVSPFTASSDTLASRQSVVGVDRSSLEQLLGHSSPEPGLGLSLDLQEGHTESLFYQGTSAAGLSAYEPLSSSNTGVDGSQLYDDEWCFAQDLMSECGRSISFDALEFPLPPFTAPLPPGSPVIPSECPTPKPQGDYFAWNDTATFADSHCEDKEDTVLGVKTDGLLEELHESVSPPTSHDSCVESVKQQRRRTVIIEAPNNVTSQSPRVTVDLSHLADSGNTSNYREPDPIPFETGPMSGDQSFSSPHSSIISSTPVIGRRPASSATIRGPIRSILKNREKKKSVRFSVMPSTYEYLEFEECQTSVSAFEDHERDDHEQAIRFSTRSSGRAPSSILAKASSQSKVDLRPVSEQVSFPKHPAIRPAVRSGTPISSLGLARMFSPPPLPATTPCGNKTESRRSAPATIKNAKLQKIDVGMPKKLVARSSVAAPNTPQSLSRSKIDSKNKSMLASRQQDENRVRRATVGATPQSRLAVGESGTSSQRSRMPFMSILTKFKG